MTAVTWSGTFSLAVTGLFDVPGQLKEPRGHFFEATYSPRIILLPLSSLPG
jgi:hypothetical protein